VGIALISHLAVAPSPISFSGIVFVASFSDVATLTATYRIGGIIPVLSPLAVSPRLLTFFQSFMKNTWLIKDRIVDFIKIKESESNGSKYHITFVHAEDDADIPWVHSEVLFWHAVDATSSNGITYDELEREKDEKRIDLGAGGWSMEWRTNNGVIRERILKFGLHDKIMSYPAIAMAAMDAFQAVDPTFGSWYNFASRLDFVSELRELFFWSSVYHQNFTLTREKRRSLAEECEINTGILDA
jgi:abhydrolase domain-containing protein 12